MRHCTQALFLEFMNAHKCDRTGDGAGAAVLSARLKLIGGCRNTGDEARVAALRREAAGLDIADFVDFHVNASWDEVTATGRLPSRYELDLSNVFCTTQLPDCGVTPNLYVHVALTSGRP